jgi:SAM-dependent methyltransferase
MDELAQHNKKRWEALAQAGVLYSRPRLDLDPESARQLVDSQGVMGDPKGKDVLCLGSGGGQQSAAFALLGANVTVLDLSETQLERDREAMAHYGVTLRTEQGDMRDLSRLGENNFDIVWQPYSINFVPDSGQVFDQVARVLRPGGLYHVEWRNPFFMGLEESTWNGKGYLLNRPYRGGEVIFDNANWDFEDSQGDVHAIEGPREFNHPLSTVLNELITRHFVLLRFWEIGSDESNPTPGSWEHYKQVAPWILGLWARYSP